MASLPGLVGHKVVRKNESGISPVDVLSDFSYPVVRFVAVHKPHVDIGVVWDSGTVVIDSGSVFSLMRLSLRRWRGGGHEGC